jgi:hypothetical protein
MPVTKAQAEMTDAITGMDAASVAFKRMVVHAIGCLVFYPVVPFLGVLGGALGGFIVQWAVGDWVVAGAAGFGLHIDRANLWHMATCAAFFGSYFRYSPITKIEKAKG